MEKFGIFHKELKSQKVSFACDSIQLEFSTGGIKDRICFSCMDNGGAQWKLIWDYQSNFKGDKWVEMPILSSDVFGSERIQKLVAISSIVIGMCDGVPTFLMGREFTDDDLAIECIDNLVER